MKLSAFLLCWLFASLAIAQPAPPRVAPAALADVNGTLFIVAKDDEHGYELWKIEPGASQPALHHARSHRRDGIVEHINERLRPFVGRPE